MQLKAIIGGMALWTMVCAACSNNGPKSTTPAGSASTGASSLQKMTHGNHGDTAKTATPKTKPFAGLEFADKKDLVCGMPLTAGIADTAYYKGKLYGFCATGCKADFVKNPKEFLPQTEGKKKAIQ